MLKPRVTKIVSGRRHQKPSRSGQRDGDQLGPHSLTGANEDPTDPEECTPTISPDMAQAFTCSPSPPGLCPRSLGHPGPSCAPITLLLATMGGDALLSPVPLKWINWSRSRKSRDCFFLCLWCNITFERRHFTCAALIFA